METFSATWVILVLIVGLNGFAAGVVALLHAWRRTQRRRSRVLTAGAVAGSLPAVLLLPLMLLDISWEVEAPMAFIGAGVFSAIAFVVSLPGAIVVARKLEGPGDAYKAFE